MRSTMLLCLLAPHLIGQAPPNVLYIENAAGPPQNIVCNPGCGSLPVAPNTWMSLYGTNLATVTRAWNGSDFINGQMPTNLNGVQVQLLGDYGPNLSAYISYISPSQINILTPLDLNGGSTGYGIQVNVPSGANNCSTAFSCPFVEFQNGSPDFFMYSGTPYVIAEHSDGTLIGPSSIAGATPARPGEIIILYANGLGPTSGTISEGSITQSGSLLTTPTVTIGALPSEVLFAGLISPGLYQVNVTVPQSASGDASIAIATIGIGYASSPGTFLPIN
jgi:uncharacterized protein (TIGR03437 family)